MQDELPLALVEEGAEGEIAADQGEKKEEAEGFEQPAGVYEIGGGSPGSVGIVRGLEWLRGSGAGVLAGGLVRSWRMGRTGHGVRVGFL